LFINLQTNILYVYKYVNHTFYDTQERLKHNEMNPI